MKITLDTVRGTLRSALGHDSFVASFINRVEESEKCRTAAITIHGVLKYNASFAEAYLSCEEDLFCLVMHEVMHPLFGHFIYRSGLLESLAADMVINAAISLLFAQASAGGSLFAKLYEPHGLVGLLRPGSRMYDSRYGTLYNVFYGHSARGDKLSTGEVIQTLKILTPTQQTQAILLLGSHGKEGPMHAERGTSGDVSAPSFPADVLARIAEDLKRAAENPAGRRAGYGDNLHEMFLEVLKSHLSIKKVLLQKFATKQKVDRFKQVVHQPRIGVSPIPIQPSKRDFVLLAAGIPPFHYHNRFTRQGSEDRGLAIYLDVSGSVNQHLPEIIGLLRSLEADLKTIFLFSNKVVEVPFKTLLAGQIQTTYGTDFDCIAEHILERGFDKAVIFTDGYASLNPELQQELKKRRFHTLTVLFGGKTDCPEFAQFGHILQLEDVTN